MNNLCNTLNIEKHHSSPYHPEGDGMAERAIGTVKALIRCFLEEKDVSVYKWPDILQQVAFLFNASNFSSTGRSPHEIMSGENLDLPISPMQSSSGEDDIKMRPKEYLGAKLIQIWHEVSQNIVQQKEKTNAAANKNRKEKSVEAGDFVFIKNERQRHSLDYTYIGPFEVIWRKQQNVKVRMEGNKTKVVHLNNCKVMKNNGMNVIVNPGVVGENEPGEEQLSNTNKPVNNQVEDQIVNGNLVNDEIEEELELPIAHRRLPRNKSYNRYGEDFLT